MPRLVRHLVCSIFQAAPLIINAVDKQGVTPFIRLIAAYARQDTAQLSQIADPSELARMSR